MPTERLQKFLSTAGVASRRACEELIKSGKIKVNGGIITSLGTKVDPEIDKIEYNGKTIKPRSNLVYIKLNKPEGYITSCKDTEGETIYSLLKDVKERVFPVGRLDKESSGLLLLTNDGDLALKLSHPRYEHEKEYECTTVYPLTKHQIQFMRSGVQLIEGKTLPAKVTQTGKDSFNIILREGKNRQIRRMVRAVNNKIATLKRIRIAKLQLGNLKPGKWEYLSRTEIWGIAGKG